MVSGVLATGEDEVDLVAFEVNLNEGRLDQVGDVLQMNGGGLVRFVVLFNAGAPTSLPACGGALLQMKTKNQNSRTYLIILIKSL